MKKYTNIETKILPIAFSVVLIIIWQILCVKNIIAANFLPAPTDVIKALITILPQIKVDILFTLQETLIGLGISILLSIVLAIVMDSIRVVKLCIYPLLVVSQTIPIISLAPLFLLWFGFDLLPKVLVVILVCFFPITISLLQGLASADKDIINLLKSMGAKKLQIFFIVKFPSALDGFFSGLKIAVTYSIMGAIIGEWLGGVNGLGVYMTTVRYSHSIDKLFAVIVIIVALSLILFKIVELLQYFLMPYKRNN